jgi:hypothetical protein
MQITNGAAIALLVAFSSAGIVACEGASPAAPRSEAAPPDLASVSEVLASVQGAGHVRRPDGTSRIFTLTATKYADGRVGGSYTLEIAGPGTPTRVRGDITCLVVDGSSAYIGGDVDRFDANPFPTVPGGMAVEIIDNGEGAGSPPDLLSPAFFTETQQEVLDYCAAPAPGPVFAIERGNFQVR